MTVSSTLCCASASSRLWLLAALLLALAGSALAESNVRSATLAPADDGYVLNADFSLDLNPHLEEVVGRGVPLYFVMSFELTRPRWYWFDETLASKTLTYRLSFHALTRQYRLSTGALHQSFASLDEALGVLSRVRSWPVVERSAVKAGASYEAALRLDLDLAQLPKPLQVSAIGAPEWSIGSDWLRWSFAVPEAR